MARIASGASRASSRANRSFFSSIRSGIASMTSSQSLTAATSVPNVIRPTSACCSSAVSLPRVTALSVEFVMWPRPRSSAASSTSTPTTSTPDRASTSAIPAPMVPRPMTPILLNATTSPSRNRLSRPQEVTRG